jgi:hypothetical protein
VNVGFCWCSEGLRVVVRRYPFRIPVIRNRDRKSLLIMNLSSYPMFICRAALGLCRLVNLLILGALRDMRESSTLILCHAGLDYADRQPSLVCWHHVRRISEVYCVSVAGQGGKPFPIHYNFHLTHVWGVGKQAIQSLSLVVT